RATISGAFSLSRVESGLLGPIEGHLTERFGVRRMMIIGLVVLSGGFILLSQVNTVVSFYLVVIFGSAQLSYGTLWLRSRVECPWGNHACILA
ncbi:MAG: hypothetical protein V1737_05690, partial [Chloroflexota bacterium]